MSSAGIVGAVVGIALGLAGGIAVGRMRTRTRVQRIVEGAREMARGNIAHRVILPGDDEAALAAEALNTLADAVQREREAASARDVAQRRLLANISHDLRTPITSIAGYVDAIQRGLGDEPERYVAVIAGKTEDLSQLTDDLFYAARIDAGDLDLACERLDLAEVVRRAVLGFEPQLAETGARVQVAIPDGPCPVSGDASALGRILSNLITNSLRHADGMTSFGVELTEDDRRYVVRITNDGPPLPRDSERLFERGVSGSAGGVGLGLSIARELAAMMSAHVRAENEVSGLVAFTLSFPREFSET